jgi:hypothetical protein
MDKKTVGYALTMAGIALIIVGVLNVAGYLNLQVVDTTPPKILYIYPADKMTYRTEELTEIVVYAQDQSDIVSAVYRDKYGTVNLAVTPYTKLRHPWIIQGWKYPDVNFDGRVDMNDANLVNSAFHTNQTQYDLNSDGIVDTKDTTFVITHTITVTFACFITPSYSANENITFSVTVLDQYGNVATLSGSFETIAYTPLSGQWLINNNRVNDGMLIEVSERKVTVTFKCNDTTVPEASVTAKVTVKNTAYTLIHVSNYTWQTTIELSPGTNSLILEASASTLQGQKMNKISVQVVTPELSTFTIGHALIVVGIIFLIGGIIVKKKEEDIVY